MNKYKQIFFYFLLILLITSVSIIAWSIFIEPNLLIIRNYELNIPNWPNTLNGMKVAVITDLHVGSPFIGLKKVNQIVNMTNGEQPDLTLLLGDFVAHGKSHNAAEPRPSNPNINWDCIVRPVAFTNELSGLKAKLGVFAILGNHDWWYDGNDVHNQLNKANIRVLEDELIKLHFNGQAFYLVGLSDLWTRHPQPIALLAKITDKEPILLLSHNPDIFPLIPERVSLTLAGHTHGGQVALPFIGPLVVPSRYGVRYARGHIVENGQHLFVSTGIGTSVLPIRFLTIPEISILTLKSI